LEQQSSLHQYFLNNSGKPIHKWPHYFDIYERHFARFRNRPVTMIEIGVYKGGSLQMWRDYLGKESKIIGLDIDPACKAHEGEGIQVYIGSQSDPKIMDQILDENGPIDVVLDDGGHISQLMIASFNLLYQKISPTGLYFVEDTQACYWPKWGGGLKRQGTFMEFTKDKIDELHAMYTGGALAETDFSRATASINVYDGVVAFERRPQGRRQDIVTSGHQYEALPTMTHTGGFDRFGRS
jgi:hypothetical protein